MTPRPGQRKKVFRRLGLFGLVCLLLAVQGAGAQKPANKVSIILLGTTDIHGHIEPEDYYANHPANRGLAKIATLVNEVRASSPHVLLLDSGDTIEGSPLAYYFAVKDTGKPNPTIAVMNAMHFDAAALGNHEFNFGLDVLWKAKRQAQFPILAANLRQDYNGSVQHFLPYIIKNVAGVRVGIVGFVTPGVPRWEIPAHYRGYQFEQIVAAARRVIPEVRKQADLVVVLAHSGLERDVETGKPFGSDQISGENAVYALANEVPGIDVILFGHTHRELPQAFLRGVLLVQAKNWGQSLARVDVDMERGAEGRWQVASKRSTTLPVTDQVTADPAILALAAPYEKATQVYLDTPIATCAKDLSGETERYEDGPLVDLIHKAQLDAGHADVSLATMFYPAVRIPAGKVTVRQLAALYVYENTLYTVEMTGAQLREALEHAAGFFPVWPSEPGQPLRLPGYNADSAEGVRYTIDLSEPAGHRIRDLTFQGKPLAPDRKLRVAVNNYRYSGGGRYTMLQGLPILYRSPVEIRDLLIEYVTRTGVIPTAADHNWKIVPRPALEAILREAQKREAGNR